jgi:chromosome segregation ATPase
LLPYITNLLGKMDAVRQEVHGMLAVDQDAARRREAAFASMLDKMEAYEQRIKQAESEQAKNRKVLESLQTRNSDLEQRDRELVERMQQTVSENANLASLASVSCDECACMPSTHR